jgi:hypothetical protein
MGFGEPAACAAAADGQPVEDVDERRGQRQHMARPLPVAIERPQLEVGHLAGECNEGILERALFRRKAIGEAREVEKPASVPPFAFRLGLREPAEAPHFDELCARGDLDEDARPAALGRPRSEQFETPALDEALAFFHLGPAGRHMRQRPRRGIADDQVPLLVRVIAKHRCACRLTISNATRPGRRCTRWPRSIACASS